MMEGVFIRKYRPDDKNKILDLFRMNTPAFFSPNEESDLIFYLEHEIELYFVVEVKNEIVGCGGINFKEEGTVGLLSWDFLHPDFQGRGIGTTLLNHRLELLKSIPEVKKIRVRTSQHANSFYEKGGFVRKETVKDYWAKGFDLYLMEYNDKTWFYR
jgi:[ribosomal protein S18]-alanine N-acetyltransferase